MGASVTKDAGAMVGLYAQGGFADDFIVLSDYFHELNPLLFLCRNHSLVNITRWTRFGLQIGRVLLIFPTGAHLEK